MSAPKNYAELFRTYYPYVVSLVRRMGITDDRKEDVAMEILLRFFERGFLDEFDPTMVFTYGGQDRPARFKSFLSKFVVTYVRGHYDKQQRYRTRELLICDNPVHAGSRGDSLGEAGTWLEVYGGDPIPSHEDAVLEQLVEEELVDYLRDYLTGIPRRNNFDHCDLPVFFDEVVKQIRAEGQWNATALRERFGVSSTALHSWIWWLRANLADALNRPVPAKRTHSCKKVKA